MGQKYAVFDENGFPKAFYDSDIHSSIPSEAIAISEEQWLEFINNQGKRVWDFRTKSIKVYTPPPPTKTELINQMRTAILVHGYIDLADVQFYASHNDPEAQALLRRYQAYDDLIWKWIDNDLPSLKTLDEIMQIDIKSVEQEIFNQSIQNNPLP